MELENEILKMSITYDYNGRGFENMEINGIAQYSLNSRAIFVLKQYLRDNCILFSDKDTAFSLLCAAQNYILHDRSVHGAKPVLKSEVVNWEIVTCV